MPGKIDHTCKQCGGTFQAYARHNRKVCSRECQALAARNRISRRCDECGTEFEVMASRAPIARFCSDTCRSIGIRRAEYADKGRSAYLIGDAFRDGLTADEAVKATGASRHAVLKYARRYGKTWRAA